MRGYGSRRHGFLPPVDASGLAPGWAELVFLFTLLYISQFGECKCADVEQGTDMRQPEVSMAMQELRRKGWVKKRDLKKKGKGRPVHIYKPTTQLSEILNVFEQEKLKEIENVKNDISALKNIIQNR